MLNPFLEFATRFRPKEVHTTNFSFKLITRITVNILFFSIVAMFSSAFMLGNVIDCYTDTRHLGSIISQRCWAEGVFIDRTMLNTTVGTKVISPGVGVWHREAEYVHQAYYQWIPPLLIIQGLIFYLPRGIWKLFEHETMGKLMGKNDGPLMTEKWKEKRNLLILYLKNINKKYHRCYVIKYFICECLSIVSIIFNMFLFKWVINDFWVEYQPAIGALIHGDLLKFRQQSTVLFPLQAKCNYTSFGNSGSMVNHDALCYMPLNVVNEKIFVFLYFWYIFILFYATLNLIYFLTLLAFNSLRLIDVGRMCERTVTRRECKKISGNGDFGFWFTLHIFHKNLSPVFFQDLAKELIERTDEQKSFRKPSSSINLDDEEEKY